MKKLFMTVSLLALSSVAVHASRQQSASYQISATAFTAGGAPMQLESASYSVTHSVMQSPASAGFIISASYRVATGFQGTLTGVESGQPAPPPITDVDGDGMDDEWEVFYFGDLTQLATDDYDNDGLSNKLEHDLGSNPTQRGAPDWWVVYGVVVTNGPVITNDYAAANAGQIKWLATRARDAMVNAGYAMNTPAGTNINNLVAGFSSTNNFMVVNIGQVKNVAKPFYDRLQEAGRADGYPWGNAAQTNDYGVVNQGQIKHVFSFEF